MQGFLYPERIYIFKFEGQENKNFLKSLQDFYSPCRIYITGAKAPYLMLS